MLDYSASMAPRPISRGNWSEPLRPCAPGRGETFLAGFRWNGRRL